jgi:transcriptional regulator with XRE-family HTH domain
MIVGDRLRQLREEKNLSHGDIEKKTGLPSCDVFLIESGHIIPSVEALEKLAQALEVPLYQLFYDADESPEFPNLLKRKTSDEIVRESSSRQQEASSAARKFSAF